MVAKLHVVVTRGEGELAVVPPAPASTVRIRDDEEEAMFHPSCEASSCQNCGAYQDRHCALLYGVDRRQRLG